MLKSELVALVEVPTTIRGEGGQLKKAVGTVYPIRDGLVLTARHVLYHDSINAEQQRIFSWRRSDEDAPYHQVVVTQTDIVFEDENFDVAVVRCDTSKLKLPLSVLSDVFPKPKESWTAMGYPRAGVEATQRKKTPAGGTCFTPDEDYYIQQLVSEGDADVGTLWKGMSGAPVFSCQTGKLLGVLIRTPNQYDKVIKYADGQKTTTVEAVFENRLVAVSIPYLLRAGKCAGFLEAVSQQKLAEALLPAPKLSVDFEQWLVDELSEELQALKARTLVLHEQLIKELGLSGKLEVTSADASSQIAQILLTEYEFESAVDVLAAAASDCLLEGGRKYSAQLPLEQVRSAVEGVLGWLVLRAIDEAQLQTILPVCTHRSSLFFKLKSVQSLAGIEIAMARRFNRKPNFNSQYDSEHESRYRITLPKGLFKWDGEESVRRVFIKIWNRVIQIPSKHKELHSHYTPDDIRYLNRQLAKRREHRRHPEHFYLSFTESDYQGCVDFIAGIYQDLLSKLHEMTVIEYGGGDEQSVLFVIPEEDIRTIPVRAIK
ncbi:MAG: serine protease [Candidatus Thiothrix putei]|uniref:Serine protease n=1 Tax=Candidatus Thiothrix putei TaxID=3080811 RepID=A0AA95KH87_9GAMM|nr:MAG: serine protease [Candidatus Thiothrix putei]